MWSYSKGFGWLFLLGVAGILIASSCGREQKDMVRGLRVPEGFDIKNAVDSSLIAYPMFAGFDYNGRLFVYESSGKTISTEEVLKNPTFRIRVLEDENGDGFFDKSTIYADNIPYPMGGTFYKGSLYVAAPPDLLRFKDTNGDNIADEKEVILSGWTLHHNAAALSGPFMGPDGWLYMADARRGFNILRREGDSLKGKGARIWRCLPDGSRLESLSGGGFDNSIEIAFMPGGETIGTMTYFTDPQGGFRDALMHWVEGGVYPKYNQVIDEDSLKRTGELMPVMTKMPRIAPAGLMRYLGNNWGDLYQDNLFSAQFNTGRIMRHIVTPSGASYVTRDEPFMQSDSADVHPTDVLQDADGSLLVVNTGGWFIAGCPLSVVAKTDVKGGLYRIVNKGAGTVKDPWGRRIDFDRLEPDALVALLADARWPVRAKAVEKITENQQGVLESLAKTWNSIGNPEYRALAVFTAYRVGTPAGLALVAKALEDTSMVVRVAAARALGLAKYRPATQKLAQLTQADLAPVRRQAATALGQIGDTAIVPALIRAAAKDGDRFTEHAITYALIELGAKTALLAALQDESANVQRVAVIALDQLPGKPLQKMSVAPLLYAQDSALKATAVWVAMHHRDWGDVVTGFLKTEFAKPDLPEEQRSSLFKLAAVFNEEKELQAFIAAQLSAPSVYDKLFWVDMMDKTGAKNFPAAWQAALKNLLVSNSDPALKAGIFNLITSRHLQGFDGILKQIIAQRANPLAFRLKALAALSGRGGVLSDEHFKLLTGSLDASNESTIQQQAVRLLARASLNDPQLIALATERIPRADAFLLPELVMAFAGNTSEATGLSLVTALKGQVAKLDNLSLADFEKLLGKYPATVKAEAASLLQMLTEKQKTRLAALTKIEEGLTRGDVEAGRQLFFGKATCFSCHAVGKQGGNFGPDLTNIGDIRARHDILEAIVYPSASFAREYETVKLTAKAASYRGVIGEQNAEAVFINTAPGVKVRIDKADILSIEPDNTSMMPSGLNKILSMQELSDLIAYLESLPDGLGSIKKH